MSPEIRSALYGQSKLLSAVGYWLHECRPGPLWPCTWY